MNIGIAYMVTHPNDATPRDEHGRIIILAHSDASTAHLRVQDMEQMERDGLITIHERGGNTLAEAFGRVRMVYTVNEVI